MSHTPFDPTHATPFAEQLSDLIANPSSSRLLYLLPPCLILLAIDVVVRLSSPNRQIEMPVEIVESPSSKAQRREENFRRLSARAHQVLANFRELDKRLLADGVRSKEGHRLLQRQRNFAHHRKRLAAYNSILHPSPSPALPQSPACPLAATPALNPKKPEGVGRPFTSFCERLLLQNEIWKQERQIKALQRSLDTMRSSTCSNAFTAFCDRLLLSNNIWRLQRELGQLVGETEKLKKSRVAAVTRAAKQMVADVRKERLTEEFVKDLISELDECRRSMAALREEHEREMTEMAGEWKKDCRRLSLEVERLKLAQDAHLLEQELSNDLEEELMTRLALSEYRYDDVAGSSLQEVDEDTETLSEGELEQMSNTSTSTFVGSAGTLSPNRKLSFEESTPSKRQRRAQLTPLKIVLRQSSSSSLSTINSPHSAVSSPGTFEPASYVGFSFNPVFFGKKKDDDMASTSGTGPRMRTISLPSHSIVKSKASSQPKRLQWRF